jgi:hypothetical protein
MCGIYSVITTSARGHLEDGGGLTATGDQSDALTLRPIALVSTTSNVHAHACSCPVPLR